MLCGLALEGETSETAFAPPTTLVVFVVVADDVAAETDVVAGKSVTFAGSAMTLPLHPAVATGNTEIWRPRDADVTESSVDAATLVEATVACLEGCTCLASTVTAFSLETVVLLEDEGLAICFNSFSNVETFGSLPCLSTG